MSLAVRFSNFEKDAIMLSARVFVGAGVDDHDGERDRSSQTLNWFDAVLEGAKMAFVLRP